MFWHQIVSTMIIAATVTGCAATPSAIVPEKTSGWAVSATHTDDDGAIGSADYLEGAAPDEIVECRNATITGSRLRRTICGRGRDDSELFGLINRGSGVPPGQDN